MDFHRTLEETIERFPNIRGIIFIDPDGESIIHYHPGMTEYDVRLTGAKIAVLVQSHLKDLNSSQLKAVETVTSSHYSLFLRLKLGYSIMVVSRKSYTNQRLREYITGLSHAFNREIL
ncbi:MAG: hypothetical protein CSA81_00210 [Acidobacteria bacterium]|nr:MAG: hypothetical protein CSA81_00210 [Acidobacteriota bacterium]